MKEFLACLAAAQRIVEAVKAQYPGCEDAVGFNVGGGSSSSDTKFARQGTSANTIQYQNLPSFLTNLINDNALSSGSDPALGAQETALLTSLMGRDYQDLPSWPVPYNNAGISPTSFTGASTLSQISARDPYSSAFETATQSAYEQRASDAMAQAATGPDAVRGGNSRTGIAQGVMADRLAQGRGQEVRNAQLQDSGIVGSMAQLFNQIEGSRRGIALGAQQQQAGQQLQQDDNALGAARVLDGRKVANLSALQLASDLLGTKKGLTTDDLTGKGSQTNSSQNWGVNVLGGCCFIFLEALNGKLPWYIENARHDYYTGHRRHGYKWMANWLVPAMRRFPLVRSAVNELVVRPFLRYGRWLYKAPESRWPDFLWGPYCELWLAGWSFLGAMTSNKKVD
jgi:hypothetical protein